MCSVITEYDIERVCIFPCSNYELNVNDGRFFFYLASHIYTYDDERSSGVMSCGINMKSIFSFIVGSCFCDLAVEIVHERLCAIGTMVGVSIEAHFNAKYACDSHNVNMLY